MSRIKRCSIVFILAFLSFLFLPCVTSAQVILTEQEAAMLGHELSIAKTSIANCRDELNISTKKLMTANERLAELSKDLEASKRSLTAQKVQLEIANQYLKEQEQEHKRQMRSLNRQRNLAYAIAATCVYIAVRK